MTLVRCKIARVNTVGSLIVDLSELGLRSNMTVMVHCSLKQVGRTEGGPIAVIRTLMDAIKPEGTLVMPAESPQMSNREHASVFDPQSTPTTMGVVAEAFRTYPGTLRSHHPRNLVIASPR